MLGEFQLFAEAYLIPIQLMLAMFGMGATLGVSDFARVFTNPVGVSLGMALQLVGVPLYAFLFVFLFDLSPGWAVGFFLVAAAPGGALSNLLTFIGRGNAALSIALTVLATTLSVVTVPLLLGLLATAQLPADFQFPTGRIIFEIIAYLLVPLVLGMVVYRFQRTRAPVISNYSVRLSVLFVAIITVSALGSGRIDVAAYGWRPPLLIILFGVSLLFVSMLLSRALQRYDDDAVAIGIEVVVRNMGVALLLVHFFFPGSAESGHVLYTVLFYAGASWVIVIPTLLRHRKGLSVVLFQRPFPRPESSRAPVRAHAPRR